MHQTAGVTAIHTTTADHLPSAVMVTTLVVRVAVVGARANPARVDGPAAEAEVVGVGADSMAEGSVAKEFPGSLGGLKCLTSLLIAQILSHEICY